MSPSSKKTTTENPVPNRTATVPNGTSSDSEVDELIKQYLSLGKVSAETFVKKAVTVAKAEKLSKSKRQQFCTVVNLQYDGSKYRKLLKIGQEASRFEPVFDRLTNSWTTLYKLAVLEKDQFDRVTQDVRFDPMMTAAEVNVILTGKSGGANHSRPSIAPLRASRLRSRRRFATSLWRSAMTTASNSSSVPR
jgi:hypothetical protein